jgi:hypothetical protein
MKTCGEWWYSYKFLSSVLDGGDQPHAPAALTQREEPPVVMYRRLGGPQSRLDAAV